MFLRIGDKKHVGLVCREEVDSTLVKVRDYSDAGDYADGWALYRFGCGAAGGR